MSLRELTFNKEILSEFWVRSETVQSSNTDPAYSDSNTIVCLCQVLHNQTRKTRFPQSLQACTVIGRLFGNRNIVRMTFTIAASRHPDEPAFRSQRINRRRTAIPH